MFRGTILSRSVSNPSESLRRSAKAAETADFQGAFMGEHTLSSAAGEYQWQTGGPPNYQTVVSVPATTLTNVLADLYEIFRDVYFKGKFRTPPNIPVTIDLDYDVKVPPSVEFGEIADAHSAMLEIVQAAVALEPGNMAGFDAEAMARDLLGPAVFTIKLPRIECGVQFEHGKRIPIAGSARISCVAEMVTKGNRRIVQPRLIAIRVKLPDQGTEEFINREVAPKLIPPLNDLIVKHWDLPDLDFAGVRFSPVELRTPGDTLLGYAAMEHTGLTIPPEPTPIGSSERIVMAVDAALVNTIASKIIDPLRWKFGPVEGNILTFHYHVAADVGLRNPRFEFLKGNFATGSLALFGSGTAKFAVSPFGWVEFNLSIVATPKVETKLLVGTGRVGFDRITLTELIDIQFHFSELPWWVNEVIGKVLSLLSSALIQFVAGILSLIKIPIIPLPAVSVSYGGIAATVQLDKVTVDTLQMPDGKMVGLAAGVGIALRKGA
jgi:hypothetical protein